MKWSVCIPTAGEDSTIITITSILKQKVDFTFKIIVVGKIPNNLPKNNKLITINTGIIPPGRARNIAVLHSHSKFIAFIDSDCEATKGWLHSLDNRMNLGAQLVGGAVLFPKMSYFSTSDNVSSFFDQTPFVSFGPVDTIAALNMSCTKELFDRVGGFDEEALAGEDLEWILRAKRNLATPFFEPAAKCIHHSKRNSFFSMIRHAQSWGRSSIIVRKNYNDVLNTPTFFFSPHFLTLLAPIIGSVFALKIILSPGMWRYAHTFPAVAASKTAWCISAAQSLSTLH